MKKFEINYKGNKSLVINTVPRIDTISGKTVYLANNCQINGRPANWEYGEDLIADSDDRGRTIIFKTVGRGRPIKLVTDTFDLPQNIIFDW